MILQYNSNIYKRLFESANAAILIIDADFRFIDCNETASKLLDRTKSEILTATPDELSPKYQKNGELSSELGREHFSSAMQGNDLRFEWIHLKKDGTEFTVEISLFGFKASNRKNFFAMWRDLTEVRKKELELIESEERFRTIFSQSSDGYTLHEKEKGCIDCNPAALEILGYNSREKLLGKTLLDISPEYQPNGARSDTLSVIYYKECFESGNVKFEWVHLKKSGEQIWCDVSLTKISYQNKLFIHARWRDITETKKHQVELSKYRNHLQELVDKRTNELETTLKNLKETQSQLIQSEKMASLGILTAGVAHEINNPLNYIMGGYVGLSNELDEEGNIKSENTPTFLKGIKLGIDRAANIVKGLNQLSRVNENYNEICDIHSIMDNCLTILHNKYKKRIELVKNYCVENAIIKGNAGKLHQVFFNILLNAIDSIIERGTISIITNSKESLLEIIFEDTGCGISKDNLNKIVDPFFTTKDPGKGTGLGLSITNTIIHDHRGKIKFNSKENKGTKVTIQLPKNN